MKKIFLFSCLILSIYVNGQNFNEEKIIYDFLRKIIVEQKLDLNHGLRFELETSASINEEDVIFLNSLLLDGKSINEGKDIFKDTLYFQPAQKGLTKTDIDSMLLQKEKFKNFKWNNSLLGFNIKNKKNIYSFSLPLFSADKAKVIMMIRNNCPGLCGGGQTILFIKENKTWISKTLGFWYH